MAQVTIEYLEQLRQTLHKTLLEGLKTIYLNSPEESLDKLAKSFTNMSLGNISGQQVNEATLQTLSIWENVYRENHLDLISRYVVCSETYALIEKAVNSLMGTLRTPFK